MSTEIADAQLLVSRKFDLIKNSLLQRDDLPLADVIDCCLLYTSPSPRDQRGSRMPSSA